MGLLGADDGLSYLWGSFKPFTGAFKKGATLFDINVYSSLPNDDVKDDVFTYSDRNTNLIYVVIESQQMVTRKHRL